MSLHCHSINSTCLLCIGLCPDWEDWDPKKAKENAKEAMDAAEKWLDVPQVITKATYSASRAA